MNYQDLAVLIISCDKFSDVWRSSLKQFRRFFPEDYRIYLGSNLVRCDEPGVVSVLSGEDLDWSTSCKRILVQIREPKLFIIVEDYFLASHTDMEGFEAALFYLFEKNAVHVKYCGVRMPMGSTGNPRIGSLPRGSPYRATVCGFWDREYLIKLLIEGENPWNFEILGSYRTAYSDGFYGLTQPLCDYRNMVEKGQWVPQSLGWARKQGINLNLDRRPVLKGGGLFFSWVKILFFGLMFHIPWRWRVGLMNKARKALISY